jgi:hypothetical protein
MCNPTDRANVDKSQGAEEKNTGPWITPHDEHDEVNGNCGRAIVAEFKSTIGTYWCQEMKNFNQKTIAVSFFIYFAAVAPAITFGAVYAKSTNNYIGPVEMLTATAWCGVFYALFGGQPMVRLPPANNWLSPSWVCYRQPLTMFSSFCLVDDQWRYWACSCLHDGFV